jgi:NADPH2:quinone reductase
MGIIGGGAYADYVIAHERETIAVPDNIASAPAAAIPEVFLTAYRALFLEVRLNAGEWCIVRPATAGVGIAAVQLIRALGARSIGTSRSRERLDAVRRFGLDAGHVDSEGELGEAVRELTGGEGAAVLLDLLGGGYLAENLAALRDEGTQVLVGCLAGRKDKIDLGRFLQRRLKLTAMTMRSLPIERKIALARLFEARLTPLFATQRLHAFVDRKVAFAEAPQAHRLMESNQHCGKIVIAL